MADACSERLLLRWRHLTNFSFRLFIMQFLPNIIAVILVPTLLLAVLYFGPNAIVECEWRIEQAAIENGMSAAIRVNDQMCCLFISI